MAGRYRVVILEELPLIAQTLASDIDLPDRYQDHELTGDWLGYGECHIRPDLLMVYLKTNDNRLYLVEIGSHSEIFG